MKRFIILAVLLLAGCTTKQDEEYYCRSAQTIINSVHDCMLIPKCQLSSRDMEDLYYYKRQAQEYCPVNHENH